MTKPYLQEEALDNLTFALRLTEVTRWGVVPTSRQQSVAEHSWRVMMIAQALQCHIEQGTSHNSFERADISSLAAMHDILEILSGDLNAVFKVALQFMHPSAYDQTVEHMAVQRQDMSPLRHVVEGQERAAKGTMIEVVVKVADFLEALLYLHTYGANNKRRAAVINNILITLFDYIAATSRKIGKPEHWVLISEFTNSVLSKNIDWDYNTVRRGLERDSAAVHQK